MIQNAALYEMIQDAALYDIKCRSEQAIWMLYKVERCSPQHRKFTNIHEVGDHLFLRVKWATTFAYA